MNTMNDVQVMINKKQYTICGYEDEEYLQKVASYINNKHSEFKQIENYSKLDTDMRIVLMEINIADDYFKVRNKVKELEREIEQKNNEIFDMKHEIIATQSKLEEIELELEIAKEDYQEAQKKIIKLETELEERAKKS